MINFINSLEISANYVTDQIKLIKQGLYHKTDYIKLLENTYNLLICSSNNTDYYNLGLSAICHISDNVPDDEFIKYILKDCIVASRVFLYANMLRDKNKNQSFINNSMIDDFAADYYTMKSGTILTKDQKEILWLHKKHKRLIVSAPTSFGKSRIIEEIILINNYKNIIIVLPTIALLSETYVKFNKNRSISEKYNLINSLSLDEKSIDSSFNIFILTPEKTDLLLDQNPDIDIDFFVMDEVYKIQDDDNRSRIFTNCLYRLTKFKCDFYLIGPYFQNFSHRFIKETKSYFAKFTAEIVQKDVFDFSVYNVGQKIKIENKEIKKLSDKDKNLIAIVATLKDQTMIYTSTQSKAETRAKKIAKSRNRSIDIELIQYIKDNISDDWSLIRSLEKGVAFHHAAIPKYIQTEIVDSFNQAELDVIVCTSTLIEGVNTSAKNIIIYDQKKGKDKLSGFDIKNIKGRAGRFLSHFIGNVYIMENVTAEKELNDINFSYFDNNNLGNEELLQIDKSDLLGYNLENRNKIENLLMHQNIPLSVICQNKFISFEKQINLINILRNNPIFFDDINFTGMNFNKNKVKAIVELCYYNLFDENDYSKSFTFGNLARLVNYYIFEKPSLKQLIANQNGKNGDTKIRNAFKLISKYFEFVLPKYLTAFEHIYNFVYDSNLNLKYIVTLLEFGFTEHHEIALKEAGLPSDIIKKIRLKFSDCNSIDEIRKKYRKDNTLINNLSDFEVNMFNKYI